MSPKILEGEKMDASVSFSFKACPSYVVSEKAAGNSCSDVRVYTAHFHVPVCAKRKCERSPRLLLFGIEGGIRWLACSSSVDYFVIMCYFVIWRIALGSLLMLCLPLLERGKHACEDFVLCFGFDIELEFLKI